MSRETGTDRYALLILCIQQGANEKLLHCPENHHIPRGSVMPYAKEIQKEGIYIRDSLCSAAETNTSV